jgi:hypothetical protein
MTTTYDAPIPYDSNINYDGGPVVVTQDHLPTWQLDITNPFTDAHSVLPEAMIDSLSFESSAVSAISFSVASGSVGSDLCADYAIVEMKANGVRVKDARWLLRGANWNAGRKAQIRQFTGRHLLWDRLEHTVIQPGRRFLYTTKSPGYILDDLFAEAQLRNVGYWENFTWTFDTTHDSNGNGWPVVLGNIEYLVGAKYSDIVNNLVDKGLIEISLLGDEIRVTVPNTDGVVRPALLVVGEDVTDAPQQSSADNIISDVVMVGEDNTGLVRTDPDTRVRYWREEASISQGGTNDIGTLSILGDAALSGGAFPRVQRSYGLVVTQQRPFLPLRDYVVGDWVRTQHGDDTQAASYRVKQIVLKQEKGIWGGTLVLNDRFLENEIRLAKKVDGILGGATITGSSQVSTPDDLKDTGIPAPMTGFNVVTDVYQNNEGITKAIATATWDLVTTNTDGTNATDMGTYYVVWWYSDEGFASHTEIQVQHPTNYVSWSNLDPGREIQVYVYSKDNNGHQGSWNGGPVAVTTSADTIPPPQPSGPLLSSLLRMFVVEWNGLTSSGQPMPADFHHMEVYSSSVNNFDVDLEGDLNATMTAAGQVYITGYAWSIGTTVYFKFVAVDNSGNRSVASSQNWTALQGVSGPDITAGAITANSLAVGSVTAQAIEVGAITADRISLGTTLNKVQDPSFNNASWRAKRLTTAWCEKPSYWFFKNWDGRARNGYYLQALSTADGVSSGRMYMCDWINTQLGESYYVAMYMQQGEFTPNVEATMTLGVEVTLADGSIQSDGINYLPFATWTKYGYRFVIGNPLWAKVRFFVRTNNLNTGDIIMDDWEVRGGVGTTEYAGSRGLLDNLGLFAWDSSENMTVSMDFRTGDFTAKGQISSGFTGKRTVVNPTATYLPEIRFYPTSGDLYAYINASDTGTYPFIGVNAPDTGSASQALVLFDNGFQLGEINKGTGAIAGAGIQSSGTGHSAYLTFSGKLGGGGNALDLFSSYRFLVTTPGSTSALSIPITKGPSALNGFVMPIYSLARPGTGQKCWHQISASSATSWTLLINTGDANPLTTVTNHIHAFYVRSDTD